ncbi:MAG TPA: M56 family metallopeptidase [Pirellulales bacterium]
MDVAAFWELFQGLAGYLAVGVVATIPVAAVAGAITWLGRRRLAPWARHAIWTVVLLRLLLPHSFAAPFSAQRLAPWLATTDESVLYIHELLTDSASPPAMPVANALFRSETAETPAPSAAVLPSPDGATNAPTIPSVTWRELAFGDPVGFGLALGAMGMIVWSLVSSLRLRKRLRDSQDFTDPQALELIAEGRARFGVRAPVALRLVPGLAGPATVGWLRPLILLPADAPSLSRAELQHILWHELSHIRRGDGLLIYLPSVVQVFHWWNPLYWIVRQLWLVERELACDALAVERLGPNSAAEYGRTLLRFMERRAASPDLAAGAPAFASFLGAKAAFTTRLRALARAARPEGRGRTALAWLTVAALAFVGLTDAAPASPPVEEPSVFEVPSHAVWRGDFTAAGAEGSSAAPRTEVEYDLGPTIRRLMQDDPGYTAETAAESLRVQFARALAPPGVETFAESASVAAGFDERSREWCRRAGERLTLTASPAVHEVVRRQLAQWAKHGRRQIATSVRIIETTRELGDLLPSAGGEIFSGPASEPEPEFGSTGATDSLTVSATHDVVQPSLPTYVRVLSDAEMRALMQAVQSDRRSNIMLAPRVTTFEGETAAIVVESQTPFVRGFASDARGEEQPQIAVQRDGVRMRLGGWCDDDERVRLQLHLLGARTAKIETLTIGSASGPRTVQIPHVVGSRIDAAAALRSGETLLVAPLRRDEQGRLHLVLTTPDAIREPAVAPAPAATK